MTTAAVTPTLGSAPVSLQAGNYSAIDDRRFWGATLQEGTLSSGSYQVIQRAAGANMSVDVTSSTGNGALVQGDSVTAQGIYLVPPTSSNLNVTIAAADATNPRNDLVVLEVKDDQHDAGGLNLARVRVITGTPNASAALTDNPGSNGTPALPSTCFLLAVVRVAAAATSVATAAISDRRNSAGGENLSVGQVVHVRDEQTSGTNGGGFTSGSFVTRTINTVKTNTITGASLASNQITLPAGTYWIEAQAPAYRVDGHLARLQNITAASTVMTGNTAYSSTTAGGNSITHSMLTGQFTLSATSALEIQHRCVVTFATFGLGVAHNLGTEVYTEAKIWRTS